MSESQQGGASPGEDELRQRLEEELRKVSVDDVLLQTVITLVNLGGRRLGIGGGTREGRDLNQTRSAIEAIRALLPLLKEGEAEQLRPVRDALSQLQMAYAREAGRAGGAEAGGEPGPESERPPPGRPSGAEEEPVPGGQGRSETDRGAKRPKSSGRLWVPPGSGT